MLHKVQFALRLTPEPRPSPAGAFCIQANPSSIDGRKTIRRQSREIRPGGRARQRRVPPEAVVLGGGMALDVGGQAGPVSRLVAGFDFTLNNVLIDGGMDAESSEKLVTYLRGRLGAPMVMPTMPVQDAIELADFLVESTKRYFRFLPGADIVGGDTDIAVVTKYEGFKWVRRKHFCPAALNPLETDHA